MAQEELRVLHLHLKAARLFFCTGQSFKAHPHSDTLPLTRPHPLQQSHTHSNKDTPPNSVTPSGPSIQIHESMRAKLFKPPHWLYSPYSPSAMNWPSATMHILRVAQQLSGSLHIAAFHLCPWSSLNPLKFVSHLHPCSNPSVCSLWHLPNLKRRTYEITA